MEKVAQVTGAAVKRLQALEEELKSTIRAGRSAIEALKESYRENQSGLGAHSDAFQRSILQMEQQLQAEEKRMRMLARQVHMAAKIRRQLAQPESVSMDKGERVSKAAQPVESTAPVKGVRVQKSVQMTSEDCIALLRQLYVLYFRKMRAPKQKSPAGTAAGTWKSEIFYPDADWIPPYKNPEHRTFGEIQQALAEKFNIPVQGIPFRDGCADFSGIAVAQISLKDMLDACPAVPEGKNPLEALKNRRRNMDLADRIAVEKQLPIPGLSPGYTLADLRKWKKENGFTWDESPTQGYLLVPTIIHGNIGHTGVVAIVRKYKTCQLRVTNAVLEQLGLTDKLHVKRDARGKAVCKKCTFARRNP